MIRLPEGETSLRFFYKSDKISEGHPFKLSLKSRTKVGQVYKKSDNDREKEKENKPCRA